jgi:Fur family ferric uptake transcriptional regulator
MARIVTPSFPEVPVPNADPTIIAPLCSIFRRFLKKQGLKFTTERALILNAVLAKEGLFEADQLVYEMHDSDAARSVSKATVYRTLKHLVEAGIIREVPLDSKQAHYQMIYGRRMTDHLVNVSTAEVIEFHAPELLALRDKIAAEHGLKAVGHRFLVYAVDPNAEPTTIEK